MSTGAEQARRQPAVIDPQVKLADFIAEGDTIQACALVGEQRQILSLADDANGATLDALRARGATITTVSDDPLTRKIIDVSSEQYGLATPKNKGSTPDRAWGYVFGQAFSSDAATASKADAVLTESSKAYARALADRVGLVYEAPADKSGNVRLTFVDPTGNLVGIAYNSSDPRSRGLISQIRERSNFHDWTTEVDPHRDEWFAGIFAQTKGLKVRGALFSSIGSKVFSSPPTQIDRTQAWKEPTGERPEGDTPKRTDGYAEFIVTSKDTLPGGIRRSTSGEYPMPSTFKDVKLGRNIGKVALAIKRTAEATQAIRSLLSIDSKELLRTIFAHPELAVGMSAVHRALARTATDGEVQVSPDLIMEHMKGLRYEGAKPQDELQATRILMGVLLAGMTRHRRHFWSHTKGSVEVDRAAELLRDHLLPQGPNQRRLAQNVSEGKRTRALEQDKRLAVKFIKAVWKLLESSDQSSKAKYIAIIDPTIRKYRGYKKY